MTTMECDKIGTIYINIKARRGVQCVTLVL